MISRMATVPPPTVERNPVGTLVMVSLVLVLAWQLAYWTWIFLAPPSTPSTAPSREGAVDLAAAARLFGGTAASAPGTASPSGLRLKGVVAPTPGVAASAIFSTGSGRDLSIFVGNEIQPGVKLSEVYPDHVIVSRGGVAERVDLEALRSLAKAPTAQPSSVRTSHRYSRPSTGSASPATRRTSRGPVATARPSRAARSALEATTAR